MSIFTPKSKNISYLDIISTQLAHFDKRQSAFSQKKTKTKMLKHVFKMYEKLQTNA